MFNVFKRDFLLGIGTGLILTGIILSLSGNGQLTDEQIIARAAKLGMVHKTKTADSDAKLPTEQPKTEQPKTEETDQTVENTPEPEQSLQATEEIIIVIKPGMNSETVTRMLVEKGIVSDRDQFYKVLTKYKAHSKLKVGTFKIPAGIGEKELVDILTGKGS